MREVIYRGSARVHMHFALADWVERLQAVRQRVVEMYGSHFLESCRGVILTDALVCSKAPQQGEVPSLGECFSPSITQRVLELLRRNGTSNSTNRPSVPFFEKCVQLGYRQISRLLLKNRRGSKEKKMKKIILLAAIAFLAGSAQAQMRVASGGASGGTLSFSHSNHETQAPLPPNVSATNPGEFVPSTFESYKEAVIIGQEELNAKPLSVAEAARNLQAWKKSETQKPALIAEQDGEGRIIVSRGKQFEAGKSN